MPRVQFAQKFVFCRYSSPGIHPKSDANALGFEKLNAIVAKCSTPHSSFAKLTGNLRLWRTAHPPWSRQRFLELSKCAVSKIRRKRVS